MVMMFSQNQAALLLIVLLARRVFAEISVTDHRDMPVSRGDSVTFHCNVSRENASEITWNFKSFIYKHSILINQTFSNVSSDRLRIDPLKLYIFSAQPEDAGLYSCSVTARRGLNSVSWNLTVSEDIEENSSSYLPYVLTSTTLLLLCVIASAVCLWRRSRSRAEQTFPVGDQTRSGSREEGHNQEEDNTDQRRNNKRRSQYMERRNSIYGDNWVDKSLR
ncbi:uncharacterized protein LOC125017652 [Mugil cephalus]|uniref:uncharacterized protein LOC125017652 n=1 Tax=Mugil cephalus TaxID=48193 RepID=UPI001FB65B03|nr:uncharacterized protein LOC125017652 [Mugil cephalus]XP_047457020.1 uncharacterized protein LOC125017652 [Mugil cephalus]